MGTNTKPLCLEFCDFVQCRILVNYLSLFLTVCASPLNKFKTKRQTFVTFCTYYTYALNGSELLFINKVGNTSVLSYCKQYLWITSLQNFFDTAVIWLFTREHNLSFLIRICSRISFTTIQGLYVE